ncbi:hypothetical protein CBOM_06547 [Ceraceosorus bombacis]|uniref:Uncharacterized protein n=1 Tax=Ceraceosorus bombacis TaxID=401625 RepID=A0A0P1BKD7_9BASI|nr:hypothetical protein CBOM_06547 [Ceraceosorus bombacis]
MLLTHGTPDPLRSIRSAIDAEESGNHVVRVAEEGTGETYDLTLSHSSPYVGSSSSPYGSSLHHQHVRDQRGNLVDEQARADGAKHASTKHSEKAQRAADNDAVYAPEQRNADDDSPTALSESHSSSGGSQSHGRRILQLPQIVSKRASVMGDKSAGSTYALNAGKRGSQGGVTALSESDSVDASHSSARREMSQSTTRGRPHQQ